MVVLTPLLRLEVNFVVNATVSNCMGNLERDIKIVRKGKCFPVLAVASCIKAVFVSWQNRAKEFRVISHFDFAKMLGERIWRL